MLVTDLLFWSCDMVKSILRRFGVWLSNLDWVTKDFVENWRIQRIFEISVPVGTSIPFINCIIFFFVFTSSVAILLIKFLQNLRWYLFIKKKVIFI